MRFYFVILLSFFSIFAQAQEAKETPKKTFQIVKIDSDIKIDGRADEPAWAKAPLLTDFIQWRGEEVGAPSVAKTEVQVLYSNEAVYVFAKNFDKRADVRKELSERDDIGNAGFFGFFLDPFLSGIEAFEFLVSTAGTQFDAKISTRGEDKNWDAVWDSKVVISEEFWTAEFKIPYSALRFPTKEVQTWGVNFLRRIQRNKEKSAWAFIDTNIEGFVSQGGLMEGIKNIEAPVRLSATPFISGGLETGPNGKQWTYGGGGDIKVGLSNAFTLDMTVIPDFSQTRSDEAILNISPFETFYSERRPFFTEGTDLFEKGDIVYTRRIGGQPLHYYDAFFNNNGKEVRKNPVKSQLINAVKISGRTDKKLGVGFLNAVEGREYAQLGDDEKYQTNPLTNYNVVVLDQQLKNNSSVALINSNVFREGHDFDANVTALDFDLNTNGKKWGTSGVIAVSQLLMSGADNKVGHKVELGAGRRSGKFTYGISYEEVSDTYDPNDFGFQRHNNTRTFYTYGNYFENKSKKFRNYGFHYSMGTERLYNPNKFVDTWLNLNANLTTKKFISFHLGGYLRPTQGRDYYEPRVGGRYFKTPAVVNLWSYISTDYNKKLAIDLDGNLGNSFTNDQKIGAVGLGLRYRFSDKVSSRVRLNNRWNKHSNAVIFKSNQSVGYADVKSSDIIFGLLNRNTFTASLSTSYKINTNMTCSFYARNYWTQLEIIKYDFLEKDGTLTATPYKGIDDKGTPLHNRTFDFFNIDFVYRWHFSPGSDLYLTWKNIAGGSKKDLSSFGHTLEGTFVGERNNSITLKVLYYLDYNTLRQKD